MRNSTALLEPESILTGKEQEAGLGYDSPRNFHTTATKEQKLRLLRGEYTVEALVADFPRVPKSDATAGILQDALAQEEAA